MSKSVCTLPFEYVDTPERRVLNLELDGIPCVPALGYSHYKKMRPSVSEHIHPGCLECSLCVRGSLVFESDGVAHNLLPGNVFVTQPDEWHRLSTNPKGLVMFWLFFRMEPATHNLLNLSKAESDAMRAALRTMPRKIFRSSDRLRMAFNRLFKYHDDLASGPFRRIAMRGGILELMLALIEAAQTPPEVHVIDRVEKIIETMRRKPQDDYSIDNLIREAALSPSQLTMKFKQITGLPPYTFLIACRVRSAQTLLSTTDYPITKIARRLGFSSSQHFAMHFKQTTGMTPSAWRAKEVH
ncbi:MAG: AraC family transcriptional regulator [Kiritimatiellae bacterium]|nr:AraC family transcriptional regulator [Kiritimatiellia bacterium]